MFGINAEARNTPGGVYDRFAQLMGVLATAPNQRRKIENDRADSTARNDYYKAMTEAKTGTKLPPFNPYKKKSVPTGEMGFDNQPIMRTEWELKTPEEVQAEHNVRGQIMGGGDTSIPETAAPAGTTTAPPASTAPVEPTSYLDLMEGAGNSIVSSFSPTEPEVGAPPVQAPINPYEHLIGMRPSAPIPPNRPIGGDQSKLSSAITGTSPYAGIVDAPPPAQTQAPAQAPAPATADQPAAAPMEQIPGPPASDIDPVQLAAALRALPPVKQAQYRQILAAGDQAKIQEAHRRLMAMSAGPVGP